MSSNSGLFASTQYRMQRDRIVCLVVRFDFMNTHCTSPKSYHLTKNLNRDDYHQARLRYIYHLQSSCFIVDLLLFFHAASWNDVYPVCDSNHTPVEMSEFFDATKNYGLHLCTGTNVAPNLNKFIYVKYKTTIRYIAMYLNDIVSLLPNYTESVPIQRLSESCP